MTNTNTNRASYKDIVCYKIIAWFDTKLVNKLDDIIAFIKSNTRGKGVEVLDFISSNTEFKFKLYCLVREFRHLLIACDKYLSNCNIQTTCSCDISVVFPVTDSDFRGNTDTYLALISEYSHEVSLLLDFNKKIKNNS